MGKKTIVAIATLAGAAAVALVAAFWHGPGLRATGASLAGAAGAGSIGALRKCRRGAQIEYTNGDCPPGTREEAVRGGSVSVLPAPPAPAPTAATAASAQPLLREWAQAVDGREMQDKRIERVIGR